MNTKKNINERELNELSDMVSKHDCGTISAFRYGPGFADENGRYTSSENKMNNSILRKELLRLGYNVANMNGAYVQNYGTDKSINLRVDSFMVIDVSNCGNLKADLIKLGQLFMQDSITYSKPSGEHYVISTTNHPEVYPGYGQVGVEKQLDKPFYSEDGKFHSVVKGRPFVFKNVGQTSNIKDYSISEIRSITENSKIIEAMGTIRGGKRVTLNEFTAIQRSGNKSLINEVSLSRIHTIWKQGQQPPFAILTAFRKNASDEDDIANTMKLKEELDDLVESNNDIKIFNIDGYWSRCTNDSYEYKDCPPDLLKQVSEKSFFVINIPLQDAKSLASKYGLDALIYYGKETSHKVSIVDADTNETYASYGTFTPGTIRTAYSKLKDEKEFTFEGFSLKNFQPK